MKRYDLEDLVTFHFVIKHNKGENIIQGWTDDKAMAKAYLEFHDCKSFSLKSLTKPYEEIVPILNENVHDEISICFINTRDKNKPRKVKAIPVPMTQTELSVVNEETNTFLSSEIDYHYLNETIPYLKKKYQHALRGMFLTDVIEKVLHERRSIVTEDIHLDQLMVLFSAFSENFG